MKTYLSLLLCFSLSACFSTNEEAGSGLPELDTTEAALTTGAVLGAGVGALIGSTAGDAGTGVVLGSIAGATSGGLIGKTIEAQERRIDQHDTRAGINTKATTAPSSRGSLADTIWSTPESYSDNSNYNRPSGTKGVAAKYVAPIGETDLTDSYGKDQRLVQLRQERKVPDAPKTVAKSSVRNENTTLAFVDRGSASQNSFASSSFPRANTAPTIELQKPKPELPAYGAVPTRRPSLDTNQSSRYLNLNSQGQAKSAVKAVEPARDDSRTKLNNIPSAKQEIKEEPKHELPMAASTVEKKEIANPPVAKAVSSAPKVEKTSICDAGSKDYDRAKNASSDSDKVFYLRRVILACPNDTGARLQLGKVYSKLGLKDEAKKEFNSVLDVDPSNEAAQDEMSIMMLDSRKH